MKTAFKPILYIIDDDANMLEALSWVAGSNGIETETYHNAKSFLEEFEAGYPGCILTDINMPEIDGMELHNCMKDIDVHMPVILITGFASVQLAVRAMKKGAFDFIEKPIDNLALLTAVRKAFAISMKHYEERRNSQQHKAPLKNLSKRESDVFNLVVQGFSSKIIGEKLTISQKTVETHRSNIMKKTNAKSLADLISLNNATA